MPNFDKILVPVTAVLGPFVAAPVNAYVLDHLIKYLEPDSKDSDAVYRVGLFVAFSAAVLQSMAMIYYQRVENHGHGHGHGHGHSHSHSHKFMHAFEHFLGLYLYNFCFGIGGVYYALLQDETPENDDERLKVSLILVFAALIYTYVEAKLHEKFLHADCDSATGEHSSILGTMGRLLFKPESVQEFFLNWGGLLSHASAGYFGIRHAIDALGLLYFGKHPSSTIRESIALPLGLIGAVVHTKSELTAAKQFKLSEIFSQINAVDSNGKKIFLYLFFIATLICTLFHVIPESIAINEVTTDDAASRNERALRAAACGLFMGVPDMIMSMALLVGALKLLIGTVRSSSSSTKALNINYNQPENLDDNQESKPLLHKSSSRWCCFS